RSVLRDGEFVIDISDDGAGIDWERVRARARASGKIEVVSEDLTEVLLAGGVSTKEAVTDVSGRGVGLSAAREACIRAGGRVDVVSRPGAGTSFQFRWPSGVVDVIGAE